MVPKGKRLTRISSTLAVLCLVSACPVYAGEETLAVIERAFEAARANEAIARQYVFHERMVETRFDKKGEVKKREARTYDVTLLDHSEFRRLIAIDDRPLSPKIEAKEQRRLEKRIKKMQGETPKQRAKRLAKAEKARKEGEEFLREITQAFDFTRTGEETVGGVPAHVISFEPKSGYKPRSREAKVLPKVRGTLWIARDDYAWVQADMETTDDVSWMLIFKLKEGARVRFKQRRINDEVWLMNDWSVRMKARAALFFKFNGDISGSYGNYRKFQSDSTMVPGEPVGD